MAPPYDLALAILCVINCIIGMITNGFLIYLITTNVSLHQRDFVRFILNRTVADFLTCLILGSLEPVGILENGSGVICTIAGFLELTFCSVSIYTEPALACNRYVSVFYRHNYKKIYKPLYVYLMCVVCWVLAFFTSLPHLIVGSLGRAPASVCTVNLNRRTFLVTFISNYVPILFSLALLGFFNGKMFFFLRRHQTQTLTTSQRTRLQTQREMVYFIMVAALLPLVLESPVFIVFMIKNIIPVSEWVVFSSVNMFNLPFAINPLISVWMVQPLRKEAKKVLGRVLGHTAAVEPQGIQIATSMVPVSSYAQ